MRQTRIAGLLVAAGVSASGAAIAAVPASAAAHQPDVTTLFGRALAKAHSSRQPLFARAKVYEVEGATTGGRSTTTAAGITRWTFAFDNYPSKSKFASATLAYGKNGFGPIIGHRSPFLEDRVIPSAPKMTLATAVAKLRAARIHRPFKAVTLRRPLGPKQTDTFYFFELNNGRNLSVDTKTGKVAWAAG